MGLWERLTGKGPPSTPSPPATVAGSEERERVAAGLDLDTLCTVMRPRALAFARAYLRGGTSRGAAIAAGYPESSAHKAGHRLLRDPFVRRYIALARVEADLAERADLAALRHQLWLIATGKVEASPREKENARSNLTRILLALRTGGGDKPARGEQLQAGPTADGWTRDARTAFERDVLGVALDEPEGVQISGPPSRSPDPSPDLRTPVQDPGPSAGDG